MVGTTAALGCGGGAASCSAATAARATACDLPPKESGTRRANSSGGRERPKTGERRNMKRRRKRRRLRRRTALGAGTEGGALRACTSWRRWPASIRRLAEVGLFLGSASNAAGSSKWRYKVVAFSGVNANCRVVGVRLDGAVVLPVCTCTKSRKD